MKSKTALSPNCYNRLFRGGHLLRRGLALMTGSLLLAGNLLWAQEPPAETETPPAKEQTAPDADDPADDKAGQPGEPQAEPAKEERLDLSHPDETAQPKGEDIAPAAKINEPEVPEPVAPATSDILQDLVDKQVFPPHALERPGPVSRADLASILIKALRYPTEFVSEFPFYRDLPKTHWAYVPVEVARERRLYVVNERGFYTPDKSVSRLEVYQALSNALTGNIPSPQSSGMILRRYPGYQQLSPEEASLAAKLVVANVIERPTRRKPVDPRAMQVHNPLSYQEFAPMVARLQEIIAGQPFVMRRRRRDYPDIPAGLTLSISPSTAIFHERLSVGDTVDFTLEAPVQDLPKGSRLHGQVNDINADQSFDVELVELKTPEDEYLDVAATVTLRFPKQEQEAFIVPGELFDVTTQQVPDRRQRWRRSMGGQSRSEAQVPAGSQQGATPSPAPQPGPPGESSGSTGAPSSGPRSSE